MPLISVAMSYLFCEIDCKEHMGLGDVQVTVSCSAFIYITALKCVKKK